jgi:hypothetical protein
VNEERALAQVRNLVPLPLLSRKQPWGSELTSGDTHGEAELGT